MVLGNYSSGLTNAYDLTVKVILLGDYSVGKTSLLQLLARQNDHLLDLDDVGKNHGSASSSVASSSLSTVTTTSQGSGRSSRVSWEERPSSRTVVVRSFLQPGGFVDVEFMHKDKNILAKISDTGGQERYRSMTSSYYRGAHGCLLMFDVTKEESFSNLGFWLENMDAHKTSDPFPSILVGTRCNSPARRVPYERAARFAEEQRLPYMELDMDHMTDVRRVFERLLDNVTVNMHRQQPIAISIRPDISGKDVHLHKKVVCSC